MKIKQTLSTLILLLSGVSSLSYASEIQIEDAYVNAPPPISNVAAGFFIVSNHSTQSVDITHISSPVAGKVEIHSTSHEHGQMKMRKVDKLSIPSHESVTLSPGNMHLMFMQLKHVLNPGEHTEITVEFSNGDTVTVDAEIRDMREQTQDHSQHHDHSHH